MSLGVDWAVDWLKLSAKAMAEHRTELIELDRAIGDSDHGENMDRGFQAVLQKLDETPPETAGAALKAAAMALMSKVGGAAGPLYGTAYLRAATSLGDSTDIDADALASALAAARDGVVARGKAETGDKTMVDAWTPAVEAAKNAASDGGDVLAVLQAAAEAAEVGAVATDPLVARKGRASYLGERSAGHRDPGAASTALLLRAAAAAAAGSAGNTGTDAV
ncbi:dihydroxyacetone kinase subunit L [Arthrobacter sp. StoSoilA2]|jgi:dihydroxyacetone kinase-like protein|uniref:dihydroxyacetone kinase subunit DhaL n=1 Tax=unclassified Arthrobacter TaxID=235627 RepID=UPI001CC7B04A|nr:MULTISPECIES: dihydroxyacetone kinase subunit DhaL [unclassified Arthrobacter]MDR6688784.1 dihydroxyacetone kinase-like protein [Arthrobacter sp. 1088]BCW34085.1 dihydroxyacetone kinase subunit L [Arthrobacter sp. StoSoilA2]